MVASGKVWESKVMYCRLGQMENPDINIDFAVFFKKKSYGGSYGEFFEPGFPHDFAPKQKKMIAMT
jgi:hypothetical protein